MDDASILFVPAMVKMLKDLATFGDYLIGCDNKASHPLMLAHADTHGEQ
ncbi:hypothetical protein [Vibrio neptunius]|uniref:Uncharacterized protein n=1 Tax=Vibrio neptunius TaxID=170651 RepID=A0ABS2ZZX0_9VIBR|nr:hypothetical protein [Vibrio neptunius]MBN3492907.1 hypothetical protein [Vibrio neptunius]MBN3515375.1 hypothetical protein [Vibrio neptunius]MBN3549439.1 hypothetical protein [Vibrio neptunius]MBN3577708.1 hypothetical protein [Vibrio neptunius]MCH9871372.1 hypothetical protein [Vibrio neptunius]